MAIGDKVKFIHLKNSFGESLNIPFGIVREVTGSFCLVAFGEGYPEWISNHNLMKV